jgi:hypothetical protein
MLSEENVSEVPPTQQADEAIIPKLSSPQFSIVGHGSTSSGELRFIPMRSFSFSQLLHYNLFPLDIST